MPTNKPEVVLPELPAHMGTIRIYAAGGGDCTVGLATCMDCGARMRLSTIEGGDNA